MTKPRLFAFTLAVFALAVIACAPARVIAEEAAQAQEDLPAAALDPETLYDILLGEIAGQRGQIAVVGPDATGQKDAIPGFEAPVVRQTATGRRSWTGMI